MDLQTRLKQLEKAYAAGMLKNAEYQELRADLLSALETVRAAPPVAPEEKRADKGGPARSFTAWLPEEEVVGFEEDESTPVLTTSAYMEMLKPGLEIGPRQRRFRLERRLGDDDTGRVWLARLLSNAGADDRRALKIFAPRRQDNPAPQAAPDDTARGSRPEPPNLRASLIRIRTRAALAALMDHPHIVKVYGWRQGEDGWPFVEMEYLEGQSLRELLKGGGLSWERTLSLLRPIAVALDHAHHQHHLLHRNLKPGNVLVTPQGGVKVLDFGLTYQPRANRPPRPQEAGSEAAPLLITPAPPPAYVRDVCALSALAYELLTGAPPYAEKASLGQDPDTFPIALHSAATRRPAAQEHQKPAELTEPAWQVLRLGLTQDKQCPSRAGELIKRLEAAQDPAIRYRRAMMLGGVAAATLAALGIALGLWLGTQRPARLPAEQTAAGTSQPPGGVAVTTGGAAATGEPPAWQIIDRSAFAAAQRINTLNAYRLYLQRCPECAHRQEAETAIQHLQRQVRIDALKTRFEEHLKARRLTGGSPSGGSALGILKELETLSPQDAFIAEGKRRIALVYRDMARQGLNERDYTAARSWLARAEAVLPGLPELAGLAGELEMAEARVRDDAAYARARQAQSAQAYQSYLAGCAPPCGHVSEAQAALEQLKPKPVPAPAAVKTAGFQDPLKDGGQGPELVLIPVGAVLMGSPPDEPGRFGDEHQHEVRIGRDFAAGRFEITFEEYDRFAEASGRARPKDEGWGRERRPVINVSWEDAVAYTQWLSAQSGQVYRLPTEAEWEYMARAGTSTARYWGERPEQGCDYANAADLAGQSVFSGWTVMECRDGYVYTAPVGLYRPNAFSLHDTLGNVLELTCSLYEEDYQGAEQRCGTAVPGALRVARGGSWSDSPNSVRAADRQRVQPELRDYYLGFRVIREIP